MKKKLNVEQLKELHLLKEKCSIILKTIFEDSPADISMLDQYEKVINACCQKNDIKGLRMVAKDIEEWTKGLDQAKKDKIDEKLKLKFNIGSSIDEEERNVSRILKNGKINTDSEYRLMINWVEVIYADQSKKDELNKINFLLSKFNEHKV